MTTIIFLAFVLRGLPVDTSGTLLASSSALLIALSWAFIQAAMPVEFRYVVAAEIAGTTISIDPAATISSVQVFAFPGLTYIAGLFVVRSSSEIRLISSVLLFGSSAILLVALGQFFLAPATILTMQKEAYFDSFTATFINRNNAGTFIGLTLLLLLRQLWSSTRGMTLRDILALTFLWKNSRDRPVISILGYAALSAIVILALFLTKSRGAILSTGVSAIILVTTLVWLRQSAHVSHSVAARRTMLAFVLITGVAGAMFLLVGGRVMLRAATLGFDDPRACVLPGLLRALGDHVWLGSGAGTFQDVFARYREPQCGLMGVWEKAHNTYIQSWIEFGILAPILTLSISAVLLTIFIHALISDRKQRGYVALGLASLLLVGIHSLVDFSMEIPAIAGFFAALISVATVGAKLRKPNSIDVSAGSVPPRLLSRYK